MNLEKLKSTVMRALKCRSLKNYIFFISIFFMSVGNLPAQNSGKEKFTEILILGTPHLNSIDGFKSSMLDQLISKLNAYNFNVIGVENMPGELLYDLAARDDPSYDNVLNSFGGYRLKMANSMQEKLDLNLLEANKELKIILNQDKFSLLDSIRLIELFIATTKIHSAVLYHKELISKQNKTYQKALSDSTLYKLSNFSESKNEINQIGVRLAKTEGVKQINYIDNFQDEALLLKHYPSFIEDYKNHKTQIDSMIDQELLLKIQKITSRGIKNSNLLSLYQYLNSEDYINRDYKSQWGIWLKTNFNSNSDLARFYFWEMRNLQITANILKLIALNPGKKILIIIGSAHKGFIERYLAKIERLKILKFK